MPCSRGSAPGEEGGLHGAGDRGQHRSRAGPGSRCAPTARSRGMCASRRGVRPTTSRTTRRAHGGTPGRSGRGPSSSKLVPGEGEFGGDPAASSAASAGRLPAAARPRCRSPPRGGRRRGAGPPTSAPSAGEHGGRWSSAAAARASACSGDVEVDPPRARRARPAPASASGRSSKPRRAPAGRGSGAGSAARRTPPARPASGARVGPSRAAETWALTTGSPAAVSRRTRVGRLLPRAGQVGQVQADAEPVGVRHRRAAPTAWSVVSTTQPGSGSNATRMAPGPALDARRARGQLVQRVPAAAARAASHGSRQASGRVEIEPRAASSGSRSASTVARSSV